jgi:hypothetical protein
MVSIIRLTQVFTILVAALISTLALARDQDDLNRILIDVGGVVAGGSVAVAHDSARSSETAEALAAEKQILKKRTVTTSDLVKLKRARLVLAEKSTLEKVIAKVIGTKTVGLVSWVTMIAAATDEVRVVFGPAIEKVPSAINEKLSPPYEGIERAQ